MTNTELAQGIKDHARAIYVGLCAGKLSPAYRMEFLGQIDLLEKLLKQTRTMLALEACGYVEKKSDLDGLARYENC